MDLVTGDRPYQRRRRQRDPGNGLHKTTTIPIATDIDPTPAEWRSVPVLITAYIRVSTTSPAGLIFELGGSASGAGICYIATDTLRFCAGDDTGGGGAEIDIVDPIFDTPGGVIRLGLAIIPGDGAVGAYVNGRLRARVYAASGAMGGGQWAGGNGGSYGKIENGSTTTRLTATTAPSGFACVRPAGVYIGAVPVGMAA